MEKVKGTRDFYPEEMEIENYILDTWKKVAKNYNYKEIEGPILESAEIYKKSGQEIPEQTYQLQDKSGRQLVLRPELTPTIARMIQQRKDLSKPIKWFSLPRCFRYEAPQSGRQREFYQFNIDCLGSDSMLADAEILATLIDIMKSFGLTEKDFYIRISNRKVLQSLIESIGFLKIKELFRLIDKKDKLTEEAFLFSLKELGMTKDQIERLSSFLNINQIDKIQMYCKDLVGKQGYEELSSLLNYLEQMNISKYCKIDLSIMRGFDYYTSTVFELFDNEKKYRAIAGGGRYDDLAGIPGVGYGMGDIVLQLFLEEKLKLKKIKKQSSVYILCIDEEYYEKAFKLAQELREIIPVEMEIMKKSIGKQFEYCNQQSFPYVIIIGEDEIKKKKFKLKDMKTSKEKLMTQEQLEKFFTKLKKPEQ
ncbi:MAG TPA: histidine--tRNA ligase [Candidatus Nanoarchaeia archaeon]|nr:histidine--tRNA ligase [Candidatus Nanoarchaeia archaeon]